MRGRGVRGSQRPELEMVLWGSAAQQEDGGITQTRGEQQIARLTDWTIKQIGSCVITLRRWLRNQGSRVWRRKKRRRKAGRRREEKVWGGGLDLGLATS